MLRRVWAPIAGNPCSIPHLIPSAQSRDTLFPTHDKSNQHTFTCEPMEYPAGRHDNLRWGKSGSSGTPAPDFGNRANVQRPRILAAHTVRRHPACRVPYSRQWPPDRQAPAGSRSSEPSFHPLLGLFMAHNPSLLECPFAAGNAFQNVHARLLIFVAGDMDPIGRGASMFRNQHGSRIFLESCDQAAFQGPC